MINMMRFVYIKYINIIESINMILCDVLRPINF